MATKSRRKGRIAQLTHQLTRRDGVQSSTVIKSDEYWADTVTGYDNPRWRDQVKRGTQAGTDLSGFRQVIRPGYFDALMRYHWYAPNPSSTLASTRTSSGNYVIGPETFNVSPTPSESIANSLALVEFIKKARHAQTTVHGGVILGELSQTIRMLRNPIRGLRSGFLAYLRALEKRRKVKGNPAVVKRQRKRILSETWLEYSFGWIPLINDINDISDYLNEPFIEDRKAIFGVGKQSASINTSTGTVGSVDPKLFYRKKTVKDLTVKYYGAVTLEQPYRGGLTRVGLDLSNFAPTAWELLPWSFLVDYFTNVGDIVSAASFAKSNIRWTMKTTVKECKTTTSSFSSNPNSYGADGFTSVEYWTAKPAVAMTRSVTRVVYTGSLVPELLFDIPVRVEKWANLLALARTHRRLLPFF